MLIIFPVPNMDEYILCESSSVCLHGRQRNKCKELEEADNKSKEAEIASMDEYAISARGAEEAVFT